MSHSPVGVVTIDLAMSIVGWALRQFGLREPLADLGPAWLRDRLPARVRGRPPWPSAGGPGTLGLAMVLGAATHVAWDSFTHPGRNVVKQVTFLGEMREPLAGYKWAQHVSTAAGLAVLLGRPPRPGGRFDGRRVHPVAPAGGGGANLGPRPAAPGRRGPVPLAASQVE